MSLTYPEVFLLAVLIVLLEAGCCVLGLRLGFRKKYPEAERECGHRLNPHQFGKWKDAGKFMRGCLDHERCTGIIQQQVCERCGFVKFKTQEFE